MVLGYIRSVIRTVLEYFAEFHGLSAFDLATRSVDFREFQTLKAAGPTAKSTSTEKTSTEDSAEWFDNNEEDHDDEVHRAIRESEQRLREIVEDNPDFFIQNTSSDQQLGKGKKQLRLSRLPSATKKSREDNSSNLLSTSHSSELESVGQMGCQSSVCAATKESPFTTQHIKKPIKPTCLALPKVNSVDTSTDEITITNYSPTRDNNRGAIETHTADRSKRNHIYSPAAGLVWDVDTSDFNSQGKTKKSRLPMLCKSTVQPRVGDASVNWKKNIAILETVQRDVIPSNEAMPHLMALRKVLDLRRWHCISRAQYKSSCGLSSVVSCWNYLFSTLGKGSLKPITQEEAMIILGFQPDFSTIKFGPFTGNVTLMRWFHHINEFYNVNGRTFFLYKPQGRSKTVGVTSDKALARLKDGLKRVDRAFIYHCYNHYFCPIGFEEETADPRLAYEVKLPTENKQATILIGDTSRKHPSIHSIKWEDIVTDLNCQSPDFVDIRRLWKGLQTKSKGSGGNLHCIMVFEKYTGEQRMKISPESELESGDDLEDLEET